MRTSVPMQRHMCQMMGRPTTAQALAQLHLRLLILLWFITLLPGVEWPKSASS
jgi:hypothetical protein